MGILPERVLQWVAMPSSRGSSRTREWTCSSRWVLSHWATCEAPLSLNEGKPYQLPSKQNRVEVMLSDFWGCVLPLSANTVTLGVRVSLVTQMLKRSACNSEDLGSIPRYSSILIWRIPRTEEPDRLWTMGLQRVGHNWVTNVFTFTFRG